MLRFLRHAVAWLLAAMILLPLATIAAQTTSPAAPDELARLWLLGVAAATSAIMGGLKALVVPIDKLSGPVKAVVVFVLSFPITWLSGKLHVPLAADVSTWDGFAVAAAVNAAAAMGLRALVRAVLPPQPAT